MGEPVGKGRPKFVRRDSYVTVRTPEKTAICENLVKLEYQKQISGNKAAFFRFDDNIPLSLEIKAFFGIPKLTSKKRRALMEEGKIRPTKKPDIDNVFKVIADSLNGIAYKDNFQTFKYIVSWCHRRCQYF